MEKITVFFFTRKTVIKAFCNPILFVLHCSQWGSFHMRNEYDDLISRITGLRIPCASICWYRILSKLFDRYERNLSATNMFLSLDMLCARISLFSASIAIQSQMYSEPTFIRVSLIIYFEILFFLDNRSLAQLDG